MERTTQGAVARPAVASAVTTIGLVGLVVAAARLARTRVGALLGPTPPSVDEVVVLGAGVALSLLLSLSNRQVPRSSSQRETAAGRWTGDAHGVAASERGQAHEG